MQSNATEIDGENLPATASMLTLVSSDRGIGEERRRPTRLMPKRSKKSSGLSLFWGISGGSLVGAVGFVLLTFYQQYDNSVTELQRDLKHFNTTCAELMRKDDFSNRTKTQWSMIEKLEHALSEKSERIGLLEHQLKIREEEGREVVREVQHLRERLASVEGKQSLFLPQRPSQSEPQQ